MNSWTPEKKYHEIWSQQTYVIVWNVEKYYFSWSKSGTAYREIFKIYMYVYRQHTIITNKVLKKSYDAWSKQTWVIIRSEKSLISFYKQSPIIFYNGKSESSKLKGIVLSSIVSSCKNVLKFGHSKFIVSCMYARMDDGTTQSTSIQGLV